MKYVFIEKHRNEFTVARMADVLGVSESGYYKWHNRLHGPLTEHEKKDLDLTREINDIYWGSHGIYGSRKVTMILRKRHDTPINHKKVERIMSENCLKSKVHKRYICTTDSTHSEPVADNLLKRDFTATAPNEKFVSDTTEKDTKEGKIYVAAILDLYGRMPVGLSVSRHNDTQLVLGALKDMVGRGYGREGSIVHSDRGSTYASKEYRAELEKDHFICSMSGKGQCWDNAPMESFWGKLKEEWLDDQYDTIEEAKKDVYEYVWAFYPRKRPHASDDYMTPADYYSQKDAI